MALVGVVPSRYKVFELIWTLLISKQVDDSFVKQDSKSKPCKNALCARQKKIKKREKDMKLNCETKRAHTPIAHARLEQTSPPRR